MAFWVRTLSYSFILHDELEGYIDEQSRNIIGLPMGKIVVSCRRYELALRGDSWKGDSKSSSELLSFFKNWLENKQADLQHFIDSLDVGLSTLCKASQDLAELQNNLKITIEKVEEKKVATEKLIEDMSVQQAHAQVQQYMPWEYVRATGPCSSPTIHALKAKFPIWYAVSTLLKVMLAHGL